MIGLAMLIGMAKKMPCAPSAKAVLTPTTAPEVSISGPPELPGLIAASVWIRLRSRRRSLVTGSVTTSCRPRAEMTPDVTLLVKVPSGLPMTIAVWPGWRAAESPMGAVGRSVASILTMARSVSVSTP